MAILKVRDRDGTVHELIAIRGEKGDTGEKGDPGEVDYSPAANAVKGVATGNPLCVGDLSPFCREMALSASVGGVTADIYGKNLLDLSQASAFTRCTYDPQTGLVTSNIENSYYGSFAVTYLNKLLMACRGKTLTFSVEQENPDAGTTVVIYGTMTDGGTFQTVESMGSAATTITVDTRFTGIDRVVFRFNQFSKTHTDQRSVIRNFQLEVGDRPTAYEPYVAPQTVTADGEGAFGAVAVQGENHTMFTDGGAVLTARYNRDLNKVIAAIEEALR